MAGVKVKTKVVSTVNFTVIATQLKQAVYDGLFKTTDDARAQAEEDVPVRKVFRYGRDRRGLRQQGRQDVRTLSLAEALGESLTRRKLGLPSAFNTSLSGRRLPGSAAKVQTTAFPTYRSKNRANLGDERDIARRDVAKISGVNRLVTVEEREDKLGFRNIPNPTAESDLSARGRYELGRAKGPTLGGALKKTIHIESSARGSHIKFKVVAGSDEIDYAKYVEFGTRRSRAQPFLRPALAKAREELIDNVTRAILGSEHPSGE